MILLFLGSLRSTIIVWVSIPLSILASLCVLSLLGQTINVMTLGGLALAVGILVDDATVEIENTHRNIAMRKPLVRAVLDGASQIAVPTFVATLSMSCRDRRACMPADLPAVALKRRKCYSPLGTGKSARSFLPTKSKRCSTISASPIAGPQLRKAIFPPSPPPTARFSFL